MTPARRPAPVDQVLQAADALLSRPDTRSVADAEVLRELGWTDDRLPEVRDLLAELVENGDLRGPQGGPLRGENQILAIDVLGITQQGRRRLVTAAPPPEEELDRLLKEALQFERLDRWTEAVAVYEQGLAVVRASEDRPGEARLLTGLVKALRRLGRADEASVLCEQAVAIFEELGDRGGEAEALSVLGSLLADRGRLEEAIDLHERALAILRAVGDRSGEGRVEQQLAALRAQEPGAGVEAADAGRVTVEEEIPSNGSQASSDLLPRLSPSCRTALGWATAMAGGQGRLAVTETLLLGILKTHAGTSEPEVLVRHFGHEATDLVEAVRASHPEHQFDANRPRDLRSMPRLTRNLSDALQAAGQLAEIADWGSGEVHLPHLFGGLLSTPASVAYASLQSVLHEVDLADVAGSYADYLRRGQSASYVAFLRERFPRAAERLTEPFRRERAGYASDATALTDYLDFHADIVPLCELIMAQDVTPPLSIGLFGEWGSGKSTFMRLMQAEIDRISDRARVAARDGRTVAFCTEVRQVSFNAWHYADANLWASLVIHLFEALGSPAGSQSDEERQRAAENERKRLAVKLKTQIQLLEEAQARKRAAVSKKDDAENALKAVAGETEEWIKADEQVTTALDRLRDYGLVISPETVETDAARLIGFAAQVREAWHQLRRGHDAWPALLPIVAAVVLGAVLYLVVHSGVIAWAVTLGVASLGAITGFVAGPLAAARTVSNLAALASRSAESIRERAKQRKAELQSRVDEAKEAVQAVQREIDEIQEGRRLQRFIEDRSRSTDYRSHLGIISLIRRDFEELSRLLEAKRLARLASATTPADDDLPGIDRVILYIDDLDRCSAARVVEVLEAVHLLLAFDIFVVVVSVDPRWLINSLQQHYHGQMKPSEAGAEWIATPRDYLEKIFQIPFALRPMDSYGYRTLVGSVLPARAVAPPEPGGADEVWRPESADVISVAIPPADQTTPTTATHEEPFPIENVDPASLRVYPHELQFAQSLWPMVTTPRAAKRLVNTYRLIRASLSEEDLGMLVTRDYRAVLPLLAALIRFPDAAVQLFEDLLGNHTGENLWDMMETDPGRWNGLAGALKQFRPKGGESMTIGLHQWIPRIARYSFQTARLAAGQSR